MVINIVLNTSFEFATVLAFFYVASSIVGEIVKDKWWKIGLAMEIVTVACVFAAFILAYVQQRPILQ